ncbi:two-component system sensor histidine kinase DesK [Allonocardiopsis opalescens]|uniref:Two-component system sensor histidine kinase DesK n=1 Tax=Allonocardiopsis opalescens TaxID=1144618 RepID=A0A2T0Q5Q3_9ACTN|nr:histidine kinase [Allonocardiopsis opalescens]PRX99041.1 two-component system sensor histidine kinase DesK [Allonocardiopsis opalescens]
MAERTETTQGTLRRLNLSVVHGSLSAVGALLVASDSDSWWEACVLVLSLVVALFTVSRWTQGRASRVLAPGLAVTAAVWAFGVLVTDSGTASYGFAIVGTIVVHRSARRRRAVLAGMGAFAAAVLAARLLADQGNPLDGFLPILVGSAGVAIGGAALTFLNLLVYDLLAELERAREREAELAVIRERVRFAGDLHDIQGHTLHVVKLKTALAEKLLRSDLARAEEELREVRALVGDTITQTKELAYAQRRLNLSAELENAKNLFEAAGIRVRVDREAEVDPRAGELLGQVLRETTTNILRHAQARQVRITLSESGITIVNDGVREDSPPELRGLSALRQRVADDGGELTVERGDGRFLTAAAFPRLRSGAAL